MDNSSCPRWPKLRAYPTLRGAHQGPLLTREYLAAVHALSRYEVASRQLALTRFQDQGSRLFAQTMIEHHTRVMTENARLLNIPNTSDSGSALVGPLSEMLNLLENVPPAGFDAAYRWGQVAAHEEARKVHGAFAEQGADSAMRVTSNMGTLPHMSCL